MLDQMLSLRGQGHFNFAKGISIEISLLMLMKNQVAPRPRTKGKRSHDLRVIPCLI